MATPFKDVYEAFLARITADEWTLEEELEIVERDWLQLLNMAIFRFKYPRVSLEQLKYDPNPDDDCDCLYNSPCFKDDLGNGEIQLLALYMKHEWVKRCIASWENIRQLYTDKDFSQANHLDKLIKMESSIRDEINNAEGIYDRVWNKRPSKRFSQLAGKAKWI
jgi:hypothetical protein